MQETRGPPELSTGIPAQLACCTPKTSGYVFNPSYYRSKGPRLMAKSKSDILNDFQEFMGRHGSNYRDWYVGTAADPKQQMFGTHKFKAGDKGLFRQALSELQAAE